MVDEKIINSLYKKAVGYTATEKTMEYSPEGDVVKKKVTSKHFPPDISALKTYLDIVGDKENYSKMSDAELENEKQRLLNMLEEADNESNETEREGDV